MFSKISFDFDGCLSLKEIQDFASYLIKNFQIELWVVTSRKRESISQPDRNIDLYKITELLGIPKERVIYTFPNLKNSYFSKNKDFVFHLDNDAYELSLIQKLHSDIVGINCNFPSYQHVCIETLNKLNLMKDSPATQNQPDRKW